MYMDLYRNYGTVQESQFHTLFITFIIFLTITNINIIIINIIYFNIIIDTSNCLLVIKFMEA
jgi:hypothetical protein